MLFIAGYTIWFSGSFFGVYYVRSLGLVQDGWLVVSPNFATLPPGLCSGVPSSPSSRSDGHMGVCMSFPIWHSYGSPAVGLGCHRLSMPGTVQLHSSILKDALDGTDSTSQLVDAKHIMEALKAAPQAVKVAFHLHLNHTTPHLLFCLQPSLHLQLHQPPSGCSFHVQGKSSTMQASAVK